ncbi:sec-independent protein translocase protein TatA [Salinibacter ruber]|uniref:twin-arginine translocase TatA/TatE family subunit n=1 Tax=Salinibacter ruber TaxID=146919 RepID=UPI002169745F|nr:sec-independent protein translocase protein TatA [Salinibacter ruber]MCS3653891.1 sec-independent protein translocase protein TatA [Salinibacter ruber]
MRALFLPTKPSTIPMGGIGFPELIIIFLVLLLVFGAKRIPEIARGIGKGIREFKSATNEISREIENEGQGRQINEPQAPQQGAPQPRQGQQQRPQGQPQGRPSEPAAEEPADGGSQSPGAAESNAQGQEKEQPS